MKITQAVSLKWFQNRNLVEKNKIERSRDSGHNYWHPLGFFLMWLIYQSVHSSCTYLWEVLYSALLAFLLCTWGLSSAPVASTHQRPVAPPRQACESKCLQTLSHAPGRHSPLGRTSGLWHPHDAGESLTVYDPAAAPVCFISWSDWKV